MSIDKLEFEHVVKRYAVGGEMVTAVAGVTLTIEPGELVALYGPSGSGKTTLLEMAAGMLPPEEGAVRFAGRDVGRFSDGEASAYRRRDVGFVYQTPDLVAGMPALDNATTKLLADGVRLDQARERARPVLEELGLGDRLGHKPRQLSGGERQRVAIARALVHQPRLILADEPTGNLDSRRGREVLALLARYCHGRETPGLLVTHDPEGARVADRVLVLRDGRLDGQAPAPGEFWEESGTAAGVASEGGTARS